jgi:transposase
LRYETDSTKAEWPLLEPQMRQRHAHGRQRAWSWREILNAIFYVLRSGIAWRLLPQHAASEHTAYCCFSPLHNTGLFETMNYCLVMADQERVGREASPSAVVIDNQSAKTIESDGLRAMALPRQ